MKGYTISTYGDRIADVYDEIHRPADVSEGLDMLAQLAAEAGHSSWGLGQGRSRFPWRTGASKYTGLTPPAQWSNGFGRKKAARRCR